jgi:hypothetical protein
MASPSVKQRRSRRAAVAEVSPTAEVKSPFPVWAVLLVLAGCVYAGFWAYAPALRGRFVFDDLGLPFQVRGYENAPLSSWLAGVRPVLMFSYWLNFAAAGREAFAYHLVNVLIHVANSALVLYILLRILSARGIADSIRRVLAIFGATLFLLHPAQTESVAYIAGRSESLCAAFLLGAFALFLAQPARGIRWSAVAGILVLYGFAVMTKEHAVILPAAFVLADVLLHGLTVRDSIVLRKRLYGTMAVLGVVGSLVVWRVLATSASAGFALQDFRWHEYFFTQWRVWWLYILLLVFPFRQNADYDLPVSHSPLDHGAIFGLVAMIAAVILAWKLRHRYPMAVFGFALLLLFLAPTSSIIPIKDVATERRLYLPVLGFVLILLDVILRSRFRLSKWPVLVCVLAAAGMLTYQRSTVWGTPVRLWSDVIAKSPGKTRAYTHLAYGLLAENRCSDALAVFPRAPEAAKRDPEVLVSWYYVYDCLGRKQEAMVKLNEAAAVAPAPGTYVLIGMAHERAGQFQESEAAYQRARKLEPKTNFDRTALDLLRRKTEVRSN